MHAAEIRRVTSSLPSMLATSLALVLSCQFFAGLQTTNARQIKIQAENMQLGGGFLQIGRAQKKKKKGEQDKKIKNVTIAQKHEWLEKIGKAIDDLAEISVEDGQLQLNLPDSYQEASNVRSRINRAISEYGGSSSSSGTTFQCYFDCTSLSGMIYKNKVSGIGLYI